MCCSCVFEVNGGAGAWLRVCLSVKEGGGAWLCVCLSGRGGGGAWLWVCLSVKRGGRARVLCFRAAWWGRGAARRCCHTMASGLSRPSRPRLEGQRPGLSRLHPTAPPQATAGPLNQQILAVALPVIHPPAPSYVNTRPIPAPAPAPAPAVQEPPRGHPDCLTGKTFVISGVLDSLKREEAADFVKRHGGKVGGECGWVWV